MNLPALCADDAANSIADDEIDRLIFGRWDDWDSLDDMVEAEHRYYSNLTLRARIRAHQIKNGAATTGARALADRLRSHLKQA